MQSPAKHRNPAVGQDDRHMRGDARLRACGNARGRILVASAPATPALMSAEGRHTWARDHAIRWACFGSTGRPSDATRRRAPTPARRMKVVTVLGLHGVDAAGESLRDEVDALVRVPTAGPVRPQPYPLVPGPELGVIFQEPATARRWRSCDCAHMSARAAARAASQLPNTSPRRSPGPVALIESLERLPPRRRAWVRDQS